MYSVFEMLWSICYFYANKTNVQSIDVNMVFLAAFLLWWHIRKWKQAGFSGYHIYGIGVLVDWCTTTVLMYHSSVSLWYGCTGTTPVLVYHSSIDVPLRTSGIGVQHPVGVYNSSSTTLVLVYHSGIVYHTSSSGNGVPLLYWCTTLVLMYHSGVGVPLQY